ncbi:MAG: YciI family protein [Pseudomonadota bacterium]
MKIRSSVTGFSLALMALMPLSPLYADHTPSHKVPPELAERVSQFLNMKLYVYETRLVGSPEKLRELLPAHLDYQVKLEDEGIMFGAGPLVAEGQPDFPPTAGMIIIRAASFEEARKIADADPMHSSGVRTYTLRRWTMNEGSIKLNIKMSGQRVDIK